MLRSLGGSSYESFNQPQPEISCRGALRLTKMLLWIHRGASFSATFFYQQPFFPLGGGILPLMHLSKIFTTRANYLWKTPGEALDRSTPPNLPLISLLLGLSPHFRDIYLRCGSNESLPPLRGELCRNAPVSSSQHEKWFLRLDSDLLRIKLRNPQVLTNEGLVLETRSSFSVPFLWGLSQSEAVCSNAAGLPSFLLRLSALKQKTVTVEKNWRQRLFCCSDLHWGHSSLPDSFRILAFNQHLRWSWQNYSWCRVFLCTELQFCLWKLWTQWFLAGVCSNATTVYG